MFKCFVCNQGPDDGVTTYRQNEKGQPGVWACEADSQKEPDPEVGKLVAVIQKENNKPRLH